MTEHKFSTEAEATAWEQGFEDGKETVFAIIKESIRQEVAELLQLFKPRLEGSKESHETDKRIIKLLQTLRD